MSAAILHLAYHRLSRTATTASGALGEVVPFVRRETAAGQAVGDLRVAQEALDYAAARLTDAEARGAAHAEVAFLRRLWRTAHVEAVLASARLGRAHLRAA